MIMKNKVLAVILALVLIGGIVAAVILSNNNSDSNSDYEYDRLDGSQWDEEGQREYFRAGEGDSPEERRAYEERYGD
ncbi:MAG: hypothetical protein PHV74_14295 [Dehalococcoidia bacterium]|nr:hypothetical protein [Dehalococcoidia bacterium]